MYTTLEIADKEYKLRLNALNQIKLEEKLGKNPLDIFNTGGSIPKLSDMITVLHFALKTYHEKEKAYDVYDAYIDNGGSYTDFVMVVMKVMEDCGLLPKDTEKAEETAEKN